MINRFFLQALAAGIAVFIASRYVPGVRVRRNTTAIGVAAVFGLLTLLLGWVLRVLVGIALLPAAIMTFGLAFLVLGLIVNTILLWATDKLIDDFEIRGLGPLVGTAGLISLAAWVIQRLL